MKNKNLISNKKTYEVFNKVTSSISKYKTPIFLLIIFFSMFILNHYTPLISDDLNYRYIWNTNDKVMSINDVLMSQWEHYFTWGGRTVAHTIAQIFLMYSKEIFNVFNAACYTLLVYLIYYISTKRKRPIILLLIHFLLFYFVPYFGEDFLWLIGSCNYCWTITIILGFIALIKENKIKDNKKSIFLMLILGILAGWSNENTGLATIIMTILFIMKKPAEKNKIKRWKISALIGNIIGYVILFLSPGNWARQSLSKDTTPMLMTFFKKAVEYTQYMYKYMGILLIIILILYTYHHYKKKKVENVSIIFFIGSMISLYSMVVSSQFPVRVWGGIVIFAIVSLISLADKVIDDYRIFNYVLLDVVIILSSIFIFDYYNLALECKSYYITVKYRESYIKKNINKTKDYRFEIFNMYNEKAPMHGADLSEDKNWWLNTAKARYYGVESITGYSN